MKKFVIIILPCLLIVAVYMFGGSLFNDKPKTFFVLSTPGAHGPSTGVKEYPGELKVATASAHLQNLHIRGNLYLSPENGGGLITLSNVQVDGALIIIALEDLTVGLRDVTAPTLTVSRSTGKVTVISQGSTQIALSHISGHTVLQEESPSASGFTQLTLADEAKVELLGSYTTLMVNGTNTELQLTTGIIEKIQVQKGLAGNHITINQDAVVQLLELHTAAEVVGEGIIEEAVLYVPNVELALTPNKLTAPEATIPEEDPTAMEGDQTPVIIYPFSKPTLQRGETIVVPVRTMPIEGISLLVSSKN
ncbi:MAG: hypothetical protein NUK65_00990, partial [Firmicutes bacterium]|nr:hypothetical protein [Bacillota bacterium]